MITGQAETVKSDTYTPDILFSLQYSSLPEYLKPRLAWDSVPSGERLGLKRRIVQALEIYSTGFYITDVQRIILVSNLRVGEYAISGINFGNTIVLRSKNPRLEHTLYHEIAGLFFKNNEAMFPRSEWVLLNPKDFRYSHEAGKEADERSWTLSVDVALAKKGFVCDYSMYSLEDDFSIILGNLQKPEPNFIRALGESPLVVKKAKLALEFMRKCSGSSDVFFSIDEDIITILNGSSPKDQRDE